MTSDEYETLQVIFRQEDKYYRTANYIPMMQQQLSAMREQQPGAAKSPKSPRRSGRVDDSEGPSPSKKSKTSTAVSTSSSQQQQQPDRRPAQADGHDGDRAAPASSRGSVGGINVHWRETMCEWAYNVIDHFGMSREIVTIAMSLTDRYLSVCPSPVDRHFFQLLIMTCVYMAIKLNESRYLVCAGCNSTMEAILKLSKGIFTKGQMERLEIDVLQRLQWHVHPPTPQEFVGRFLGFAPGISAQIHSVALYLIELSTMDYFFVNHKQSEVAYAAMLFAACSVAGQYDVQSLDMSAIHPSLTASSHSIKICYRRLAMIYRQSTQQQVEYAPSDAQDRVYGESQTPTQTGSEDQLQADTAAGRTESPPCVMMETYMAYSGHTNRGTAEACDN